MHSMMAPRLNERYDERTRVRTAGVEWTTNGWRVGVGQLLLWLDMTNQPSFSVPIRMWRGLINSFSLLFLAFPVVVGGLLLPIQFRITTGRSLWYNLRKQFYFYWTKLYIRPSQSCLTFSLSIRSRNFSLEILHFKIAISSQRAFAKIILFMDIICTQKDH